MGPYTDKGSPFLTPGVHGSQTDSFVFSSSTAGVAATNGGGTQILASHGSIVGPGGSSLYVDNGQVLLVYHYYGAEMSYLGAVLQLFPSSPSFRTQTDDGIFPSFCASSGINELNFSSGWPVVV
jgi:hypothetical protein